MEVNGRIKLLRKTLGLTQQRFAEPLCMTQNSISSIEKGLRGVNDRLIHNLVRSYGVSEQWLKTGEEPMFLDLTAGLDVEEDVKQLGRQYLRLTEQQRKLVRDMVDAFLGQSRDGLEKPEP